MESTTSLLLIKEIFDSIPKLIQSYSHVNYSMLQIKSDNSLLTPLDAQLGLMISEKIYALFPDHDVISEDCAKDYIRNHNSRFVWLVDPLDGTTNFYHGLPFYATSISCIDRFTSSYVVSGVYAPTLNWMFLADGDKASFNGDSVKVSDSSSLSMSLLMYGAPRKQFTGASKYNRKIENLSAHSSGLRRTGSAVIDLCLVGSGKADGYFHANLHPWDIAAGFHIISAAGGLVSHSVEELLSGSLHGILASNRNIYGELEDWLDFNRSIEVAH